MAMMGFRAPTCRRAAFRLLLGCLSVALAAASAMAAGPKRVAVPDRALWPEAVNSANAFDRASRAEILTFANVLARSETDDADALKNRYAVRHVDMESVDRIRARYWSHLLDNYRLASARCAAGEAFCPHAEDLAAFKKVARDFLPPLEPPYRAWQANASAFHGTYLDELLRLAALFPRISSEIDRFSDHEIDGADLPDKHFLLTFDDGPTAAGGSTDRTLSMLRETGLHATFFLLGDALERRIGSSSPSLPELYRGMCVGIHGWEHKSHASWPQWQDSVKRSAALVQDELGANWTPLFRPPYGQRRADSAGFFDDQHLRVMLWGIDSQDWNAAMSPKDVQQRILSLMLLWRHGIILFHDIHPKARTALPWILEQTGEAGLDWVDCRRYPAGPA